MPRSWFGLISVLGLSAAGAAGQSSGTSAFSMTLQGKGSGQGIPSHISAHLYPAASALAIVNFVGGTTQIPLQVAGIVGNATTTEIFLSAAANPKDFLHFTDSGATLNNMGRDGTATLDYGGGAFEKAAATVSYHLICTLVCYNGVGLPVGNIFAFGFSMNGTLYLPTATAQAIFPSIFPAATVNPSANAGCSYNVAVTPNGVDVVAYEGGGGVSSINHPVGNLTTAPSGTCADGGGGVSIINHPAPNLASAPNSSCPYDGSGGSGPGIINQPSANLITTPTGTCFDGGGGTGSGIINQPSAKLASGTSTPSASLVITPPWQPVQTAFSATATCSNLATCWVTVPTASGVIPPFANVPIAMELNFGTLPAGVYPASFALTLTPMGGSAATESVPFNLIVAGAAPTLNLSETGFQFQAVAGSSQSPPAHSISLASSGVAIQYTATASTLSGGNWLSVTPGSGSVSSTSNGAVSIAANPAGLAAGTYFGRVDISAPGASQPLQSIEIGMTVAPAAGAAPIPSTTGVIFVTPQGTNPAPQFVTVSTFSPAPLTIAGQAAADDLSTWLTGKSSSTSLQAGQTVTETLSANVTGLTSGVYTGTLYESATVTSVQSSTTVLLIVTPPSGTACTPTQLLPVITNLGANFELLSGLPVSVEAQIVDDCGSPLTSGSVQASFTNTDSPVTMTPSGSGLWSGTWLPHEIAGGPVSVAVSAQSSSGLSGSASATGTLDSNSAVPVVTPGGIVSAANPVSGVPLSPGAFISIYGSNLAATQMSAPSYPYTTMLGGTQVLLGGIALPLQFVGSGLINALVPFEIPVNGVQQLMVAQNGMYSLPETVTVAPASPEVFTQDESGHGPGVIVVYKADGSAFETNPNQFASAGDTLVIYCTGLGVVSPAVADGFAAPLTPLSNTVNPVTVTIGGVAAKVGFAGLTPTLAGLYQVNVTVPAGIAAGGNVPVILTIAGFSSAPVTVAIR